MEQHNTSKNVTKRLKLFENEILFLVDNIGCNVSSHFDRIPSKDANYLPQIKLLSKLHAIINQRKCNPCNLYNKRSCKYVERKNEKCLIRVSNPIFIQTIIFLVITF